MIRSDDNSLLSTIITTARINSSSSSSEADSTTVTTSRSHTQTISHDEGPTCISGRIDVPQNLHFKIDCTTVSTSTSGDAPFDFKAWLKSLIQLVTRDPGVGWTEDEKLTLWRIAWNHFFLLPSSQSSFGFGITVNILIRAIGSIKPADFPVDPDHIGWLNVRQFHDDVDNNQLWRTDNKAKTWGNIKTKKLGSLKYLNECERRLVPGKAGWVKVWSLFNTGITTLIQKSNTTTVKVLQSLSDVESSASGNIMNNRLSAVAHFLLDDEYTPLLKLAETGGVNESSSNTINIHNLEGGPAQKKEQAKEELLLKFRLFVPTIVKHASLSEVGKTYTFIDERSHEEISITGPFDCLNPDKAECGSSALLYSAILQVRSNYSISKARLSASGGNITGEAAVPKILVFSSRNLASAGAMYANCLLEIHNADTTITNNVLPKSVGMSLGGQRRVLGTFPSQNVTDRDTKRLTTRRGIGIMVDSIAEVTDKLIESLDSFSSPPPKSSTDTLEIQRIARKRKAERKQERSLKAAQFIIEHPTMFVDHEVKEATGLIMRNMQGNDSSSDDA